MFVAFIVLIILCAVLLVLVVLAQNPKGGGLSSQFGGSGTSQLMGVKKTSDFLEKATWGLAIAVLVLTVAANLIQPQIQDQGASSPNLQNAGGQNSAIPGFNADSIQSDPINQAPDQNFPLEDAVIDTTRQGN